VNFSGYILYLCKIKWLFSVILSLYGGKGRELCKDKHPFDRKDKALTVVLTMTLSFSL